MKQFQIKTHGNENLALAIQEKLFELGHRWGAGGFATCLERADEYIHVGLGGCREISHSNYSNRGSDCPLITLDELFAMTAEPKATIKIGDQTFDKAEFEKATENLKPIK